MLDKWSRVRSLNDKKEIGWTEESKINRRGKNEKKMGRQGSSPASDGGKKKKITISLWAVSQRKITSWKSHAKSYRKRKKRTLIQRSQKEKSFSRYAHCTRIKRKKKAGRNLIHQKRIIKVYGLHERTRLKRGSCENGKVREITS